MSNDLRFLQVQLGQDSDKLQDQITTNKLKKLFKIKQLQVKGNTSKKQFWQTNDTMIWKVLPYDHWQLLNVFEHLTSHQSNVELHVLRQAGNHYQNSSDSIGLNDDDYLLLKNMIGCCSVFKTAPDNALVFIRDSRSRDKNSSCWILRRLNFSFLKMTFDWYIKKICDCPPVRTYYWLFCPRSKRLWAFLTGATTRKALKNCKSRPKANFNTVLVFNGGTLDFEVSWHLSEESGITQQLYIRLGIKVYIFRKVFKLSF